MFVVLTFILYRKLMQRIPVHSWRVVDSCIIYVAIIATFDITFIGTSIDIIDILIYRSLYYRYIDKNLAVHEND